MIRAIVYSTCDLRVPPTSETYEKNNIKQHVLPYCSGSVSPQSGKQQDEITIIIKQDELIWGRLVWAEWFGLRSHIEKIVDLGRISKLLRYVALASGLGFLVDDSWLWIPGFEFLGWHSGLWTPGSGRLDWDSCCWMPGFGFLVFVS